MAKVTFVIGLCASGKTDMALKLKEETGAKIFDDVVANNSLPDIAKHLSNGHDCILEEIRCCRQDYRDYAERYLSSAVPSLEIEYIFFENDLEDANWNVNNRLNKPIGTHEDINRNCAPLYNIPDGAKPIPIFRVPKKSEG